MLYRCRVVIRFLYCWGKFFFFFIFIFSLTCYRVFFSVPSGISLVTLLCYFAVCKFRYSFITSPLFIASFLYRAISVTSFLEVGFFFGGPDQQPYLSQHLVSSFVFIVLFFYFILQCLKVVFSVL